MSSTVDLRSDTLTTPTDAMREAMSTAAVGDDCYGEDPTVNALQDLAADMLGMEAALFVPTGTMANQIALRVFAKPGAEVICDEACHLIHHESGATAMLSQMQLRGLPSVRGVMSAEDVRAAIRPADHFQPDTAVIEIENTHNAAGGTVWTVEEVASVSAVAKQAGIPLVLDGARLFNACVALDVEARNFAAHADVVTLSLYKCLSAPVGSLVCGSRQIVEEAWLYRRVFGGAMRQAGIVAAAGIVALSEMIPTLSADHEKATRLAEGLTAAAPTGSVSDPVTNMVVFNALTAGVDDERLLMVLSNRGVRAGLIGPGLVRFVTHKDISMDDIDFAVEAFRKSLTDL